MIPLHIDTGHLLFSDWRRILQILAKMADRAPICMRWQGWVILFYFVCPSAITVKLIRS